MIPDWAWTRAGNASIECDQVTKIAGQFDGGPRHGVPLGGLGSGGINRDWTGAFRRWTLKPGVVKHLTEPANVFGLWRRAGDGPPLAEVCARRGEDDDGSALSAWPFPAAGPVSTYHGLFPKAWYAYPTTDGLPVSAVCEQFSPVIPHDYEAGVEPVALFRWHLANEGETAAEAAVLFSLANMIGWFAGWERGRPPRLPGGACNRAARGTLADGGAYRAIVFDRARCDDGADDGPRAVLDESDGQMAIAVRGGRDVALSLVATYPGREDGAALWESFAATGTLPESDDGGDGDGWLGDGGFSDAQPILAGALAARVALKPGERRTLTFALAWDLPVMRFGAGNRLHRRHTLRHGRSGRSAQAIAAQALDRAADWSATIDRWHAAERAAAEARGLPPWLVQMMLNETYLAVEGYTVWSAEPIGGSGEDGFFGVIECPDYPYYDTFDLWVYASWCFLRHWPRLEKAVIRAYAAATLAEDRRRRRHARSGATFAVTERGAVPHDLGSPEEDPGRTVNGYAYQDPNRWKDLNAQFVVTVWRDVSALDDDALARDCWPAVTAAMDRLALADRDGDGMIENAGIPDQTFDNIPMDGVSAYCGGLWIAALEAAGALAERLGENQRAGAWRGRAAHARAAFEAALWSGRHYRLDSRSEDREAVLLEQLFGPWCAAMAGLDPGLDPARMATARATAFTRNAVRDAEGRLRGLSLITGYGPGLKSRIAAHGDASAQTDEMLTGINISFAAQLLTSGERARALEVLEAVYRAVWVERGLWFRTPAAIDLDRPAFRATMNLRPLVIWALAEDKG